jgi:hypothetical protein
VNGNADDDSRMISRQQAAERVSKAYREGLAKETRKHRASAAKRVAFTSTIGAWLVRMIGGGGGI